MPDFYDQKDEIIAEAMDLAKSFHFIVKNQNITVVMLCIFDLLRDLGDQDDWDIEDCRHFFSELWNKIEEDRANEKLS